MTYIKAFLEAYKRNGTIDEIFYAACNAAPEIAELVEFCRDLLGTNDATAVAVIKDRIRELVS